RAARALRAPASSVAYVRSTPRSPASLARLALAALGGGGGLEPRRRAIGHEHLGQLDRAVLELPVLEQGDDRSPDGHGGPVERVRRLRAPTLSHAARAGAHANVQPARLVVGRVRARRQLAVALLAGQPRLAVVLLGGRVAEVVDGDVDDAVGQRELAQDLLLDREDALVLIGGVLGRDEAEHLDLLELVHAEDAARVLPGRTGLAAEARGEAGVAQRQLLALQDLAVVQ